MSEREVVKKPSLTSRQGGAKRVVYLLHSWYDFFRTEMTITAIQSIHTNMSIVISIIHKTYQFTWNIWQYRNDIITAMRVTGKLTSISIALS
jgi:hypothetical protein